MRALLLGAALAVLPLAALAQDKAQSLADIRAELSRLAGDLQALRSELVQGGAPAMQAAGGASALDRMNAIEAALTRLTAQTEQVQNNVNRVVSDGTNRIGDLEFRLCELEEGCDPANLPITQSLGGAPAGGTPGAAPVVTTPPAGGTAGGAPELAVAEQADFDRAKAALDSGDFQGAAEKFATFTQTYPGGPLSGAAHFHRGEALHSLGQTADSARAFLESFSGAPDGPRAPDALYRLGASLNDLGQTREACVTLGEVGARFPASTLAGDAAAARNAIGCN